MTYGQIRDDTLRLMNRYSMAGEKISESYNEQADYLERLPMAADDGQLLIATTVRPIMELFELKSYLGERIGGWLRFELPGDFFRPSGRGLIVIRDGEFSRSHEYHLLGTSALLAPEGLFGSVTLEYCRYPRLFGSKPDEAAEADNAPETHALLPYYAAAHLAMHDDSFAYAALLNEFEARLERLKLPARAERYSVADAYGGFGYEG